MDEITRYTEDLHFIMSHPESVAREWQRLRASAERERELREALKSTTASLVAAISLLERTPASKKAAPSNNMFAIMLEDYSKSVEKARSILNKHKEKANDDP